MADSQDDIIQAVMAFIAAEDGSEAGFDALALRLFAYQFAGNEPFQRFCRLRGRTPATVAGWRDIPPVPIDAFKDLTLSCVPPGAVMRTFMTSGTTQGVRGCSHHSTLDVYDASMTRNFQDRFMGEDTRLPMAVLFPTEAMMANSSLAHYLALALQCFGTQDSGYFVSEAGVEFEALFDRLARAEAGDTPFALLGASFSLVHVLDEMAARDLRFALPEGSRILDTGGFKGQSRELEADAFYDTLTARFGVPRRRCINMYGMTELSTQFYDDGNEVAPSVKSGPPWIRTRVVDPLSGRDVPAGAIGVLAHTDLAHFNICTTILTEDAGRIVPGGFELLGRAGGAEAQGCSLAVDEFLRAAQG